jgi:hypothetical protein
MRQEECPHQMLVPCSWTSQSPKMEEIHFCSLQITQAVIFCYSSRKQTKTRLKERLTVYNLKLGMVVHTCNPAFGRHRQEDCAFQASLGYNVRPCLKKVYIFDNIRGSFLKEVQPLLHSRDYGSINWLKYGI